MDSVLSTSTGGTASRRVWPFFSTPFHVFMAVMGPIGAMSAFCAAMPAMPGWIRLSGGVVLVLSLYALYRGYGHRIEITPDHVRYRSLRRDLRIPWSQVRRIDRYIPLDRNLKTQYVYVTRLESPPVDWREIDNDTIQLQDRPGLLEALRVHLPPGRRDCPNPSDFSVKTS